VTDFAAALRAALLDGNLAPFAATLLHRAQLEDGLSLAIGRDAIVAETLALAAAFSNRALPGLVSFGSGRWRFVGLRLTGTLHGPVGPVVALEPQPATFIRHLWLDTEGGRGTRIISVSGWAGLPGSQAERWGASHPAHRPLGELRSGRAQLQAATNATAPLADRIIADLNARTLNTGPATWQGPDDHGSAEDDVTGDARRDWWLSLFARVPDAHLTLEASIEEGSTLLLLWRLQGHINSRRFNLPGSTILGIADGRAQSETVAFDELALAATAHRPFHPE